MLRSPLLPLAASSFLAAAMLNCSDPSAPDATIADKRVGSAQSEITVTPQQSGTTNRLQAISPVNDRVAWASGVGGTYAITRDGGATWTAAVVPGAEALEFRDVEAVTPKKAYLLAAGPADSSRIYKTEDGGQHWTLQFKNQDPNAFYDCFAFWNHRRALTMSDAVNGVFPVIRTSDGNTWTNIGNRLPAGANGRSRLCRERNLRRHPGERQCLDRHRRRDQGTHSRHDGRRRLLECLRYAHCTRDRQFRRGLGRLPRPAARNPRRR